MIDRQTTHMDDFQRQAWDRAGEHARSPDSLAYFPLGLCEEAGEAAGVVKKHAYSGRPFDRAKYVAELGDVLWYLAMAARGIDCPLSQLAEGAGGGAFDAYQRVVREIYEPGWAPRVRGPRSLAGYALGLCIDAGKAAEVVHLHAHWSAGFNRRAYRDGLAQVLVALALAASVADVALSEVAAAQVAKNHARYPDGFTRAAAAARADEAPRRGLVAAVEVQGSEPPGWLVTLECGHKRAVREKLLEYPCRECPRVEATGG